MKKLLSIVLVFMMVFAISGCGEKESGDPNLIKIGKYEAEYLGSEIVKDSEDGDAIVITYNFTNKGDEEQSFEWAFYYKVKQNDEELDYAVVWASEDSYDTLDETMRENVAPGKSKEVKMTYKLKDLTSPVVIDFSDLYDSETDQLTIDLSTVKK